MFAEWTEVDLFKALLDSGELLVESINQINKEEGDETHTLS
jgi:hypothetical protein